MISKWFGKLKRGPGGASKSPQSHAVYEAPPPNEVATCLDLWLEQAASLKQLRMQDHARRKLDMARGVTLESMKLDPQAPLAWVNIARVQLASEDFSGAKETISVATNLAHKQRDKEIEEFAEAISFQAMRLQEPDFEGGVVCRGRFEAFVHERI